MEEALRVKKSIELSPESTRMLFGTNDRYIKQLEEELAVDLPPGLSRQGIAFVPGCYGILFRFHLPASL